MTGADTEEAASQLYKQSKDMLKQGGFNLRKFMSNSQELQRQIEGVENVSQNDSGQSYVQATLQQQEMVNTRSWEYHGILPVIASSLMLLS